MILCGGKGTRIGGRKAFFKLAGRELLLWTIYALKPLFEELMVVVKDENDVSSYNKLNLLSLSGVRILTDTIKIEGPLVGIYSAFSKIKSVEYVYVHPVDSPIVIKEVIEYLFERAKGYDICLFKRDDGSIEPLQAVYKVKPLLTLIENYINIGNTSPKSLLLSLPSEIKVNYVTADELRKFDKYLISFSDIDTPKDVELIEHYLKSR